MPDPRAVLDYTHIDPQTVTFSIDNSSIVYSSTVAGGSAAVGKAVRLTGNSTVGLTVDGSHVLGRLQQVEYDGKCTVQTGGFMKLPGGLAATLTAGSQVVGAAGTGGVPGYIRNAAAATLAEVAVARGNIIDASVATEVVVRI